MRSSRPFSKFSVVWTASCDCAASARLRLMEYLLPRVLSRVCCSCMENIITSSFRVAPGPTDDLDIKLNDSWATESNVREPPV
jgi:hypothetical protein